MRAHVPASPDAIDLTALGAAARRALPALAGATLAVGLACYAVLSLLTPKYASQAQIEIVFANPFERRASANPEIVTVRMDKEAVATHVRALMSSDLGLKLASELNLAGKSEFNSALVKRGLFGELLRTVGLIGPRAGESEDERVLAAYYDALRVYQIKDTRGIIIDFRSEDAKLAADVANKLAETYRDDLSLRTVLETKDASAKLVPLIKKLAAEVADAEAEVTRFRGQANIFDSGRDKTALNDQQLTELTAEQVRAATTRAEAEARARSAREQVVRGSAESQPDVQKSQVVPRLVDQRVRLERQVAETAAALLPAHPRMKQLRAELAGLNQQILVEVAKVVDGLEREAKVAALREDSIKQRIEEAKRRVVSAGGDDVKVRALESIAKSKRTELERLQSQLEAARTTSDVAAVPGDVQIISRARPTSDKAWPKVGMFTLLAMAATLLLGFALVVTRELFAGARPASMPLDPPAPIERRPQSGGFPQATPTTLTSLSAVARLLAARAQGRVGFRTLVVGESAGTDAGEAAVELTRQLARQKRQVILLDWSLDGVGIAHDLGISPTLGIIDVLSGRASFEDVIGRLSGSEAHVIAAGSSVAGGAAARDRDRVNMLLDALDETYDHVVITGRRETTLDLFTTIEGRIDAGLVVADAEGGPVSGNFLGLTVADLDVIRYEPDVPHHVEEQLPAMHSPVV